MPVTHARRYLNLYGGVFSHVPRTMSIVDRPQKSFVLAILYMLHVERFSSERPRGDIDQAGDVNGEILERYNIGIPCSCRADTLTSGTLPATLGYANRHLHPVRQTNLGL